MNTPKWTLGKILSFLLGTLALVFLSTCNSNFYEIQIFDVGTGSGESADPSVSTIIADPSSIDAKKAVCDPFANNPNHPGFDMSHGIVGTLKYLPDNLSRYSKVADYQAFGTTIDATLFFSMLNVPTRSFSLGFSNRAGELITNQSGNTLYEYFSLRLESQLQLSPTDLAQSYQLAVISDDGAIVRVDQGSGYQVILNNDGDHPSRFTASKTPITFSSRQATLPIQVDYYQGPRYHISLILMWRPWPGTENATDSFEGKQGNSLFFDSTQVPSVETSSYKSLISSSHPGGGWKPIGSANFLLPDSVTQNPCNSATAVTTSVGEVTPSSTVTNSTSITIQLSSNYAAALYQCSLDGGDWQSCASPQTYSGLADGPHQFVVKASANGQEDSAGATYAWTVDTVAPVFTSDVKSSTVDSFTATWTTDEPSTTQFSWGQGTQTNIMVVEDPTLSTYHSVTINGLASGTSYSYNFGGKDGAGNQVTAVRHVIRTQ